MVSEEHPYIKREWLLDRTILAYTIKAVDLDILMRWSRDVVGALKSWPQAQPLLLLYNLSAQGVGLPYLVMSRHNIFNIGITEIGQKEVERIFEENPDMQGCLALVLSNAASGRITQKFASGSARIQSEIFFDYDAALQWLIEQKLKLSTS